MFEIQHLGLKIDNNCKRNIQNYNMRDIDLKKFFVLYVLLKLLIKSKMNNFSFKSVFSLQSCSL